MEDLLAIILVGGGGMLGLLAFSPVGKAFADRIRGGRVMGPDPEVLTELDQLRQDLTELQERLDFTERVLAQQREADQLSKGTGGTSL
jgi:hypothetical protein